MAKASSEGEVGQEVLLEGAEEPPENGMEFCTIKSWVAWMLCRIMASRTFNRTVYGGRYH